MGVVMVIQRAFRTAFMRAWPMDLDLQSRVPNAEAGLQFLLRLGQEAVARMSVRHDEMSGECRLGGAHCPDMEMMDAGDARQRLQGFSDLGHGNAARHAV
jgi:hypothetical protein